MHVYFGEELKKALEEGSFQEPFPESVYCNCRHEAFPLMLIDDVKAELAHVSPSRTGGKPIWPHDSAAFALYMCSDCGEVICEWNQA